MAVTDPIIADFNECFAIVVKSLGIQSQNDPSGATVATGAPYSSNDIKDRLQDADYELRIKICDTLDNPFRELYFRDHETTDYLANGNLIPAGVSQHSTGWIKTTSGALENTAKKPQLANSLYEVEKCQNDFEFYGSPWRMYFIHAGRVYLAKDDAVIKFDAPKLLKTANTLFSPDAYKWGVIALTITKCFVVGSNREHRDYWLGVVRDYYNMIEGRSLSLPEPEQLKRIG